MSAGARAALPVHKSRLLEVQEFCEPVFGQSLLKFKLPTFTIKYMKIKIILKTLYFLMTLRHFTII